MNDFVTLALVLAGGIIAVGFLGNLLFERTGFPDMFFLIMLGIAFGPVLGLFDVSSVMRLAPYLAALALVFILFDGGMRMSLYQVFAESPRASLLAFLGFLFSVSAISLFMTYLINIPLLHAVLFGSIFGGSSSVVVISLAGKIKMSEKCSTILILESAITDVLCIVVSLALIEIIITGHMDYAVIVKTIAGKFSTGAVMGAIFGIFWLSILRRVAKSPYSYMLTLAIVLLAYALSEYLGGSGPLCSLLLGMVLGNERDIYRILKKERPSDIVIDIGLRRFESEIAFLMRSFFFVYLGLIATINDLRTLIVGVSLALLLFAVRYGAVFVSTLRSKLKEERLIMWTILTRGLAAAVLSTLPTQYVETSSEFAVLAPLYINTAVVIIISTAIITTIGSFIYQKEKREETG
ncbi:MAG: cation:proton antiporter [Candidatus Bathyarchaeia archaeon]